jgi:precorrin-6B methylase 2
MRLLLKFIRETWTNGLYTALRKAADWLRFKTARALRIKHPLHKFREHLATRLTKEFNSTVRYGPFMGLRLLDDSWWGRQDRPAMFLGLYEREVLESLASLKNSKRCFIDIGAADGYYAIGVLVSNMFRKSYCFEANEKGQKIIWRNAALNGVSSRLSVQGFATKEFHKNILPEDLEKSVVLIDIEGGEFEILDESVFKVLRDATIIVEIHDWIEDADVKLARLKHSAEATHTCRTFSTSSRDLSDFSELKMLDDNERWLLCSEGRPRLMSWLQFNPIR